MQAVCVYSVLYLVYCYTSYPIVICFAYESILICTDILCKYLTLRVFCKKVELLINARNILACVQALLDMPPMFIYQTFLCKISLIYIFYHVSQAKVTWEILKIFKSCARMFCHNNWEQIFSKLSIALSSQLAGQQFATLFLSSFLPNSFHTHYSYSLSGVQDQSSNDD